MKTKNEFQKEIDDLQKKIEQLTKRRVDLSAERELMTSSIDAQAKTIGAALLESRDTAKESDALTRDRVKLEGIAEAVTQATKRLDELKQQQEGARRGYAMVDFNRVADEVDSLLVSSVDKLRAAVAELKTLEAKFGELHQMSGATGVNIDYHDHLRFVRGLSHTLREGLEVKLLATEAQGEATAFFAKARAKKSG